MSHSCSISMTKITVIQNKRFPNLYNNPLGAWKCKRSSSCCSINFNIQESSVGNRDAWILADCTGSNSVQRSQEEDQINLATKILVYSFWEDTPFNRSFKSLYFHDFFGFFDR